VCVLLLLLLLLLLVISSVQPGLLAWQTERKFEFELSRVWYGGSFLRFDGNKNVCLLEIDSSKLLVTRPRNFVCYFLFEPKEILLQKSLK
jgi:hypothetical protein